MRTIGVVTVGRSDYGIYLPILRRIQSDPDLQLKLFVGGMHLSPEFGLTVQEIETDGFNITARVEMLLSSDTPAGIAKSTGLGVIGFAQAFAQNSPDILLLLGDRFEMMAAALAALPFKIPLAHLHGGEVTQGAIDEALRHSITKMSHLHFVATEEYGRRVAQLGEEEWRITVSGAPSLDNLTQFIRLSAVEIEAKFCLRLQPGMLLVTFHPVTLEYEHTEWQTTELLAALQEAARPIVFTMPNADTAGRTIIRMIKEFVQKNPGAQLVDNLGARGYFTVMSMACAMVGNSSSGMIEAASFKLPVVNVGSRQTGRTRAANILDTGYKRGEILKAIRQATTPAFRRSLSKLINPYGKGQAARTIVSVLKNTKLGNQLLVKRFCDSGQEGG